MDRGVLQLGLVRVLPAALTLLLIALMGILTFSSHPPMPPLLVSWACVYYWSLFQPARMGYGVVMAAGLLQDVVYGFPLGVSVLTLVICRFVVLRLKRLMTSRVFLITWSGFAVLMVLAVVLMSATLSYASQLSMDGVVQMVYAAALSWLCYPLVHFVCNRIYSLIPHLQLRNPSL